jgi:predicted ATP-binding protein involved in virulence
MNSAKPHHDHNDPVFIVGMNGSGTTMLLDHLGEHLQSHLTWSLFRSRIKAIKR